MNEHSGITACCMVTARSSKLIHCLSSANYRLIGLVIKASASRAEDPEFESRLRRDFSGVESYQ